MGQFETFPNAPITEAVMDIKAHLPPDADPEQFESFYEDVKKKYSEKQRMQFFEAKIEFKEKKEPGIEHSPARLQGYIFRSLEEKKMVQTRIDGFTFNKLKPYESWEKFFSEGRKYWELYKKMANPLKVTRIALRYINLIEIPLPIEDLEDYILTNPKIAPGLPQTFGHYFMRLEIHNPKIDSIAIITQTIDRQKKPGKLPLIFDIDTILESEYNIDEERMWQDFDKLRDYKNQIFFESTTNKAKELFR